MNQERYFNANSIEITKKIKQGRTFLVHGIGYESEKMAQKIAIKKKSYFFEVYNKEKKHYGYAIPN